MKSVQKWHQRSEVYRNKLIVAHLRFLLFAFGECPIPLGYWLFVRSLVKFAFRSNDSLFPPYNVLTSTGETLRVPELRKLFKNIILGTWALDAAVIERLWKELRRDDPRIVVECGAGVSTLTMAKHMASRYSGCPDRPCVFSIEQDPQIKQEVENRLKESGLHDYVRIIHAPVSDSGKYELDASQLDAQLGSEKVDWLLIDGPAGPSGCRIWTLPALARFCKPDARWFLDDGFRDEELHTLLEWSSLPGLAVEGIYPIGKGLATGLVKDPRRVPTL